MACNLECQAPDKWYQSNRTQPLRQQPWYHVLVDGTGTTTYAAQENLEPDDSGLPIEHPLLSTFFDAFAEGHYERNDQPWPEW